MKVITAAADPVLRTELLGAVRVWSGRQQINLGSSLPRAVFAMLAMRANSVVSRDELIDGVWGEAPPATVGASLYTYISSLRKALEPERSRRESSTALASDGGGYRLQLDPENLDVVVFDRLRERAQRQFAADDLAGALDSLDEGLGLWQGEPLAGIAGPFAQTQRSRLAELRAITRELWAEVALENGLHSDVVTDISALVDEYPTRERPRSLLMLALYRCGRNAEALDTFRAARHTMIEQLGVEPGPLLQEMHQRILANDPALLDFALRKRSAVNVAPVAEVVKKRPPAIRLVGRDAEVGVLRSAIDDVVSGSGRVVWIEGEMGIGKSAVLAAGCSYAEWAGCQVARGGADSLGRSFPLRVVLDCLGVNPQSSDARRTELARALRDEQSVHSVIDGGDPVFAAIDKLIVLVEELCADQPLALLVDDLQWADEASLEVWRRLCDLVDRLPLLLVGVTRPVQPGGQVDQLRRAVEARDGTVMHLKPLAEQDVAAMVGALVGASPGPGLRDITARTCGNPLYIREMADALVREDVLHVGGDVADVAPDALDRAPRSLVSAVTGRLGFLSESTQDVLRWAALLGSEFAVVDLSVVLGRPVSDLVAPFEEAITAGVLRDAGLRLAFRHPLIRQALYEGTPEAVRVGLHHQAAEALARASAPAEHVAAQLLEAAGAGGGWVLDWLMNSAWTLIHRAPQIAVELLQRTLAHVPTADERHAVLMAHLSRVLFRTGRDAEAQTWAERALPGLSDRNQLAEMRWILAYVPYRASRPQVALSALDEALRDRGLPDLWRARLVSLRALVQRAGLGEVEESVRTANEAIELGERVGDAFAVGQGLEVLWQVDTVRRDHGRAVMHLDRALSLTGNDITLTDLRLVLLDKRMFTLQCLDRLPEAGDDLRRALEISSGTPVAGVHVAAGVHQFWLGKWDEAVEELGSAQGCTADVTSLGLRERRPLLLLHGVGALIAAHRDEAAVMAAHLDAGETLPLTTTADRENSGFLVAARAVAAARESRWTDAIEVLGTILDTRYAPMMVRHQWLPDLVRFALAGGDVATAQEAVAACEAEAGLEVTASGAGAAAQRCRSVFDRDPDGLHQVAEHYRRAGRTFELAQTLEDTAVLLTRAKSGVQAAPLIAACVDLYRGMGAVWDLRRVRAAARER